MCVITRLSHKFCPSYTSCNSSLTLLQVSLKLVVIEPEAAAKATAIAATITKWPWPDVAPICPTCANAGTGKIDNIVINTRVTIQSFFIYARTHNKVPLLHVMTIMPYAPSLGQRVAMLRSSPSTSSENSATLSHTLGQMFIRIKFGLSESNTSKNIKSYLL